MLGYVMAGWREIRKRMIQDVMRRYIEITGKERAVGGVRRRNYHCHSETQHRTEQRHLEQLRGASGWWMMRRRYELHRQQIDK